MDPFPISRTALLALLWISASIVSPALIAAQSAKTDHTAAESSQIIGAPESIPQRPKDGTSQSADEAYQEEVLHRCQGVLPKRFKHGYAHYEGPMTEESFFMRWKKRRPQLPQIYLPIGWSAYFFSAARVPPFQPDEVQRAKEEVTALLAGLDKTRSYFSVQQFAGLLAKEGVAVPCDLKLTIFVGGGPDDEVFAPHVNFVPIPLLSKLMTPSRRPRRQLVTFAGGFLFWQDYMGIRTEMRDKLQNVTGFDIKERVPDWQAMIRGSVFHLCPRGNGPSSYRQFEALQAGTIPIYIWDQVKWLPFEDVVDWESIALVVPRSEIATIPERVAATDAAAMRAAIEKTRGVWRYNYTSEYILTRIRNTGSDPGLRGYRPNSTDCRSALGAAASGAFASDYAAAGGGAPGQEARSGAAAVLAEVTLAVDGVMGEGADLRSSETAADHAVHHVAEEDYHVGNSWDYGKAGSRGGPGLGLAGLLTVAALVGLLLAHIVRRRRMRRAGSVTSGSSSASKPRRRSALQRHLGTDSNRETSSQREASGRQTV